VTIRHAKVSDLRELADLAKRTWSDAFGTGVCQDYHAAELEEGRSEEYFAAALRDKSILVAETNGVLVGYVQFGDEDIPEVEVRPGGLVDTVRLSGSRPREERVMPRTMARPTPTIRRRGC
jgi:hypothetical protein